MSYFYFVSMEILLRLNPAITTHPLKRDYVEPLNSGATFTRLNLSWMLFNMAINYRFFKFLRPSQLKTIVRLWSSQLSSKDLSLLLSSILCPYLFKNLVKAFNFRPSLR